MSVLVTGGAGFIGSHAVVELLNAKEDVVIIDNLVNSKIDSIDMIEKITGKRVKFYKEDLVNRNAVNKIFDENPEIDSVIHFAGLKAVGESVDKPIEYYENNLQSTLVLVDVMRNHGVKKIVFSSSATVYGNPKVVPITEDSEVTHATNPYGETKVMIERILTDIAFADKDWSVVLLRYFNPIGAHSSGLLWENPKGIPTNLLPFLLRVAKKEIEKITVFGNDYPTPDGTCIRDYIHIEDLAQAHLASFEYLLAQQEENQVT